MPSNVARKVYQGTAVLLAVLLTLPPATAQTPPNTLRNGSAQPGIIPAFLFEPETPFASLKSVPTWNELEQLLDNPYAVTTACTDARGLIPGNDQGFPSYCSGPTVVRRQSFGGVILPPLLMNPLNYNPTTGFEMRMINPGFRGGNFDARSTCECNVTPDPAFPNIPLCTVNRPVIGGGTRGCNPPANTITVSAGGNGAPGTRTAGAEELIDYNSPFQRDTPVCIASTEAGAQVICGGDPGEPGYAGFGVLNTNNAAQYSTPAVPGVASASTPIAAGQPLVDPSGCGTRNAESPGSCVGGPGGVGRIVRLRKPTIRLTPTSAPNYIVNNAAKLAANPTALTPSNENDYIRDTTTPVARDASRLAAMRLGKALFWDMQVGSDGVQSCGSCHFAAGADNRTKNQLNPNHIGGGGKNTTLEVGNTVLDPTNPAFGMAANYDLKASDFPLHKLVTPDTAGDPACTTSLVAAASGALEHPMTFPFTVCSAANQVSDVNDVVSSMGVHFGLFGDIPPIGAASFGTPSAIGGVKSIVPDVRSAVVNPATGAVTDNIDPIPAFATAVHATPLAATDPNLGHEIRRVEPRNTPTLFLAANNFDNFWDGRARHAFNGGSVFGAADPQSHVFVDQGTGTLTATRQIIKFASLASLATGPGLSEFEMSQKGRNWAKIGKKLLQGTLTPSATSVTPLANQLVDPTDSILGPLSNQGGSLCATLGRATALNQPGLCTTYQEMVQAAFNPALWQNTTWHLDGCYTDGLTALHPNQCAAGSVSIPVLSAGAVVNSAADPFDGYVLRPAAGAAIATNTNQFTQMEGNFSLFWGLAIHLWGTILVPDNTPFDQFLDANPDAFKALGEPGEAGLVADLPACTTPGQRNCFTPVGPFQRLPAGTAQPDPLLGLDIFFASNLSLKNPNFRTGRCGECHAIPALTDHTMQFTHKAQLRDFVAEFISPGVASTIEPLGRFRVISGFLLESEISSNGQDAVERRIANQSIVPCNTGVNAGLAFPGGLEPGSGQGFGICGGSAASFFDNGVYNLGVRPIVDDGGRGGNDAFGWPLSLAALMMKNAAGVDYEPGVPMTVGSFTAATPTGGLWEETAQDQQINPGSGDELVNPMLPPYLYPWANNINVGDAHPDLDEAGGAPGGMLNTLTDIPMMEGFSDTLGPFNPAAVIPEGLNATPEGPLMGTWPVPNRVGRDGSFKAAQLREVELTGPYFHNGGKLTLRQVVDFYTRGGDFPISNAAHRDFNLVNMDIELQSNLNEDEKVALVDFLIALTDERVRHEQAPFDHPEVFVPLDGTSPENTFGRDGFLATSTPTVAATTLCTAPGTTTPIPGATGACYRQIPAVGALGGPAVPAFMGLSNTRLKDAAAFCGASPTSQYCH